ncbi:hypothetical protein FRC03_011723 [Tulasnella sp. 419]|nr:hypothetical protein FRC03_011723 [Tulasnella sp. 419]
MKISSTVFFFTSIFFYGLATAAPTDAGLESRKATHPEGVEVNVQSGVDWKGLKKSGKEFGVVFATTGPGWKNPEFDDNYTGCTKAGLICGAYHAALPSQGSGSDQAKYFINNGGNWSKHDKNKLPGSVAIYVDDDESQECYGLQASAIVKWLHDFSDEYYHETGRYPVIATQYKWWKKCTNNDSSFKSTNALGLIGSSNVPGGWDHWSFLEYDLGNGEATYPGQVRWYGSSSSLKKFAKGS